MEEGGKERHYWVLARMKDGGNLSGSKGEEGE